MTGIVTAIGVVKAFQNEIDRRLSLKVLADKERRDGSEQLTHRAMNNTLLFHQFSRVRRCDECFGIELCFW